MYYHPPFNQNLIKQKSHSYTRKQSMWYLSIICSRGKRINLAPFSLKHLLMFECPNTTFTKKKKSYYEFFLALIMILAKMINS